MSVLTRASWRISFVTYTNFITLFELCQILFPWNCRTDIPLTLSPLLYLPRFPLLICLLFPLLLIRLLLRLLFPIPLPCSLPFRLNTPLFLLPILLSPLLLLFHTIVLHQYCYIDRILKLFNMHKSNAISILLDPSSRLHTKTDDEQGMAIHDYQ